MNYRAKTTIFFTIAGIVSTLIVTSCGTEDSGQARKAKPAPTEPAPITFSQDCLAPSAQRDMESNVFTCPEFASLRFEVAAEFSEWFSRNTLSFMRSGLRAEDQAFFVYRFQASSRWHFVEVGVFYQNPKNDSDLLKRISDRFTEMRKSFRWDGSMRRVDDGFRPRSVFLDAGTSLTMQPTAPQFRNQLMNDRSYFLNRQEALDFWQLKSELLLNLNQAATHLDWISIFDRLSPRPRWEFLDRRPAFVDRIEFQILYRWQSQDLNWEDRQYQSPIAWRLSRTLPENN